MVERIAIFGAGGMLGSDLVRRKPADVAVLPFGREVDITERENVRGALRDGRPTVAVNVAAYNNVDKAETDFDTALTVNRTGPLVLSQMCAEFNIPLIHVSTDYVYSGRKKGAYVETDPAEPVCRYGESKLLGEKEVRTWGRHYIVRTASLYGAGRVNHAERVLRGLQMGETVRAAEDMICQPTYTGDLAEWMYDLIRKKPPYGIYHAVHKGACTRYEFAEWLCEAIRAKKPVPLEKVPVAALGLPAARPLRLELSVSKWESAVGPLPTVREGLERYLSEMNVKIG